MNGCGFCTKMQKEFEDNGYKIGNYLVQKVDSASTEGNKLIKKYNIQGFPAIVNVDTDKVSMGFKKPSEHLKELTKTELSEKNDSGNSMSIILVGRMGCPYCVKMKKLLDSKLGPNNWKFTESNSQEGKDHMEKYKANGVPLTINNKNGKHVIGYKETVLEDLN